MWGLVRLVDRFVSLLEDGGQLLEMVLSGTIVTLLRGGGGRCRGQQRKEEATCRQKSTQLLLCFYWFETVNIPKGILL